MKNRDLKGLSASQAVLWCQIFFLIRGKQKTVTEAIEVLRLACNNDAMSNSQVKLVNGFKGNG